MEPTQDRAIDGTGPVGRTMAWIPAATQQAQRLLAAIGRRRSWGRERLHRLSAWLDRLADHRWSMAGFQPLNLQWYRPEWTILSSGPAGKHLWRHEYIVRTITVPQDSSQRNGLPVNPSEEGLGDGSDAAGTPRNLSFSPWEKRGNSGDGALNLLLAPGSSTPERIGVPPPYSPRLQIQSRQTITQVIRPEHWLAGQPGERPALVLAASSQPRREISPSQYRSDSQEQAGALDRASDEPWSLLHRPDVNSGMVQNSGKAGSPAYATASLVDELFDRGMQSQPQPQPGLDVQLVPLRTVTGPASESPQRRMPEAVPQPARAAAARPPSIQFSRHDVNRVADQVAQVLKQRERFERERKGGLS